MVFFTATALLRPAVNTLVSKLAGDEQGFAAGMITAYMSLGNMIGPALAGILFDINMIYPYIIGTVIYNLFHNRLLLVKAKFGITGPNYDKKTLAH